MTVYRDNAAATANHAGTKWCFCSTHCQQKFVADPSRYLKETAPIASSSAVTQGVEYTCPMHPEVRQVGLNTRAVTGMIISRKSNPIPEV